MKYFDYLKDKKIARTLLILILATTIVRMLTKDIPNVEPIMAATMAASILLGGSGGFLVGGVCMLISDLILGPGIHTIYTVLSFGLIGILSGVWKKTRKFYFTPLVAISLTIIYDIITNIGFAFQFRMPVWQAEIAGIPFMILHVLSNLAICSLSVPIIVRLMAKEMIPQPIMESQKISQKVKMSN